MRAVARAAVTRRLDGASIHPFARLDVSVRKRKHAGIIVLDRGAVKKIAGIAHVKNEAGIAKVQWRDIKESEKLAGIHRRVI